MAEAAAYNEMKKKDHDNISGTLIGTTFSLNVTRRVYRE
jgi:hypothetical protein